MKQNKRRRLYAVTSPGRTIRIGMDGTSGGRVGGNNPVPTFSDWTEMVDKVIKEPSKAADHIATGVLTQLKDKLESHVKTKGNFTITYNPSEHTNGEEPIVPAFVENSKSKHVLANASDDRVIHKTAYHTGNKPSKGVLAAKKLYGSGYRVLEDSMISYQSVEARNILTQRVGFNQKQYHVPPIASQCPLYLVKDLIGFDRFLANPRYDAIKTLSNVINIKQQFMIKNTSANFPMKFKIHLVKIKDSAYSPVSLNSVMVRTFYLPTDDLNDFTVTKSGLVPKWLQHDPLAIEGGGNAQSIRVLVSNKLTNLNKSSNFRSGLNIVETFSKVIPPGDFWNFSHTHHCGDGVDLQSVWRATQTGPESDEYSSSLGQDQGQMPFHLGIIFECQGKTAEAYSIPAENAVNSYIGTSPCSYSYEFKTSAYFAADQNDTNNVQTPSTRAYEQSNVVQPFGEESGIREVFFLPTELAQTVLTPIAANVGKAYVPAMTSTNISSFSFEAGQDPG